MPLALALAVVLAADQEPEVSADAEDARVWRIGATLLGGGLGLAVPLLTGVGIESAYAPCTLSPGFGCQRDRGQAITAAFVPISAGVGLGLGHSLVGGRAGAGFGLAGGLAGYLTAAMALGLVSLAGGRDWATSYPAAGAGMLAAFTLVGAVGAMELRHSELVAGAQEWHLGRGVATGGIYLLALAPTTALTAFLTVLFAFTSSGDAVALTLTAGALIGVLGGSAAAWGIHRALGGRGGYAGALLGALASASIAALFLAVHAHAPPAGGLYSGPSSSQLIYPMVIFAGLIGVAGPAIGLEWSSALHGPEPQDEQPRSRPDDEVQVRLQGGLLPGGATVGFGGTF